MLFCEVVGAEEAQVKAPKDTTPGSVFMNHWYKFDVLEKFRNQYGAITVKQPDVWGQARIMQHRAEFEREMSARLTNFDVTFQGSRSTVEQSSFSSATGISAGLGGSLPQITGSPANAMFPTNILFQSVPIQSNNVRAFGPNAIQLDPVEDLNQRARYINHLQELRRINEGDDTADSAGYNLYLLRMPVSVDPGQKTQKGYGAEITVQVCGPSTNLLHHNFRLLVRNDLALQLSQAITPLVNSPEVQSLYTDILSTNIVSTTPTPGRPPEVSDSAKLLFEEQAAQFRSTAELATSLSTNINALLSSLINLQPPGDVTNLLGSALTNVSQHPYLAPGELQNLKVTLTNGWFTNSQAASVSNQMGSITGRTNQPTSTSRRNGTSEDQLKITKLLSQLVPKLSSARFGRSAFAFPSSEMAAIYGFPDIVLLAQKIHEDLAGNSNAPVTPLEVQDYLMKNLDFAYGVLQSKCGPSQFNETQYTNLACAIKSFNIGQIDYLRQSLRATFTNGIEIKAVVPLLGWPLVVESALLAEHLKQQIETLPHKEKLNLCADPLLLGIEPTNEAVFSNYVRQQWPMHVFALDPVTQDQNIADSSSIRRNLQISLSAALSTGKINASQFMNYSHQLALDLDAIYLNRTVAAFANGNDTFGWRFFPRFSTQPKVKNQGIERGMRECTALLVIPAVFSDIVLKTKTRWFGLDCPAKTEPTFERMYYLSSLWQKESNAYCSSGDANYLREDREKGQQLWDELKAALPLQKLEVSLPNQLALGGFTLFNDSGVTFLGPELYGYRGNPATDGTNDFTVYLVGNHFSIRGTQVLANGVPITNSILMSRELMQVTIPGFLAKQANELQVVVATPYGVSGPIPIKSPLLAKAPAPPPKTKSGYNWKPLPENYTARVGVKKNVISFPDSPTDTRWPAIVRASKDTDAILAPQTAQLAFKFSIITPEGEFPVLNSGQAVLQIVQNGAFKSFEFNPANDELFTYVEFSGIIWPQIIRFLNGALDHYCTKSALPSKFDLKLTTYLRLDDGALVQTDDPFVITLKGP